MLIIGNVRTKDIKKASHQLVEMYPEDFSDDFEQNKKSLHEMKLIDSKIVRNKVAGYIVRVIQTKKLRGQS